MSDAGQFAFVRLVKQLFPEKFSSCKVLEIGSLNINGTVRDFFSDCDYTGLDIAPGKDVDVVCEGQSYDAPDASFDVVISCEVMEHNPYWAATLTNMIRLLKPSGLMVMSCRTIGHPEHGTADSAPSLSPLTVEKKWSYYRNLTRRDIVRSVDLSPMGCQGFATDWETWGLYFIGMKGQGRDAAAAAPKIAHFQSLYRRRFLSVWSGRVLLGLTRPTRAIRKMVKLLARA